MINHEEYFGGGDIAAVAVGATHLLHRKRYTRLNGTGGAGTATLRLPYSKGLKAGHSFYVRYTTSVGTDLDVEDYGGSTMNIYDKNGAVRTLLDVSSTSQWGTDPCILCMLKDGSTADGTWDVSYVGDGT